MTNNLGTQSASELISKFKSGELSPLNYAKTVVERANANKVLNALQNFDADAMITAAENADINTPLAGLPYIAKDNINSNNFPTSGGTSALLNNRPKENAPAVTRLKKAGGYLAAKAGMHELAFGITSNNAATGAIKNPHDITKIPGGSSGGTAAAVAAGIVPVGLGTDTGGSCRIPAALCGVVGFRPTTGRYPSDGVVPISHTRDTVGTIARSVEDVILFDGILSDSDTEIKAKPISEITIGVPREVFFDNLEPEVATAVEAQLDTLKSAGATLKEVSFSDIWSHNEAFSFPVVLYEVMRDLPAYLAKFAPDVSFDTLVDGIKSPDVAGAIGSQLGDDAMPQEAYDAALNIHRPKIREIYASVFAEHGLDAIAFPTTPLRARCIGEDETVELNGEQCPTFPTYIRNTDLSSNIGAPGITLPCVGVTGLPVGIELDGLIGEDETLLSIAMTVEEVLNN